MVRTCIIVVAITASFRLTIADELDSVVSSEPIEPIAPVTDLDSGRVQLGALLFADKQLSSKNMLSCLSCHDLSTGGTVRAKQTVGYNGRMHRFNAPSIFNVGRNYRLGWRGNFTSLEQQNEAVLLDHNLMATSWSELIPRLRANAQYRAAFQKTYGRSIRRDDVLNALATYERSLVTPDAPFDRYLRGDLEALSNKAKSGYRLFKMYGCASCHQGSNVGGNLFQKFGIFVEQQGDGVVSNGDLGRWTVTHADSDIGVFRVPSLRNVGLTAPYFHDGRVASLGEAVGVMGRIQLGQEIPENDVEDLVAFLKSLTGTFNGKPLKSAD
jgi:cytochrome c peroxidase